VLFRAVRRLPLEGPPHRLTAKLAAILRETGRRLRSPAAHWIRR